VSAVGRLGQGTTFTVHLPTVPPALDGDEDTAAVGASTTSMNPSN
jgi:hypothetical protein